MPHNPTGREKRMGSTEKPVRWGVVGTGWASSEFVGPAILRNAGSRLVACVGSTPEKGRAFAEHFKAERAHATLDALYADPGVDAVYLSLPNAMHHAAVLAGARAGKHLLCEKPFAMTAAHAREMVEACRSAGITLRVAHQIRCDEAIGRAREIVRSGRLGRLVSISLERISAGPPRKTWRQDFAQSGVVFDVGVHLLDLVQWVSGQRFVEVAAFTQPDRRDRQPDDTITVLGRLEGDCQAVVRAAREVAGGENNLVIEGSAATLATSALRFAKEHIVRVRDGKDTTEERFVASPAYDLQIAAFEAELRGERSVLPDGEDSAYTVAVTQAVLAAVEERRIVKVGAA